ncbi:unnamed protein product [Prorocentrum cordatum]|uniref:SMODS-associated and fused to various effectors domain-containing protein n=1 Tax=Prorocentrum cordatum TaxID=2364126 RepID=A0ABN9XDK4_9DINO|nr:unnamed protein product [Polarella glacialis]
MSTFCSLHEASANAAMALRHLLGPFDSRGSMQNDTRTLGALAVVLLLLTAPLELSQLVFAFVGAAAYALVQATQVAPPRTPAAGKLGAKAPPSQGGAPHRPASCRAAPRSAHHGGVEALRTRRPAEGTAEVRGARAPLAPHGEGWPRHSNAEPRSVLACARQPGEQKQGATQAPLDVMDQICTLFEEKANSIVDCPPPIAHELRVPPVRVYLKRRTEWARGLLPLRAGVVWVERLMSYDRGVQQLLDQIAPTNEASAVVQRLARLVKQSLRRISPDVEVFGFASADLVRAAAFGVAVPEVDIVVHVSLQALAGRMQGPAWCGPRPAASVADVDLRKLQKSAIRTCTDRLVSNGTFKFRRSAFRGQEPKVTLLVPASLGLFPEAIPIDFSVNATTPLYNSVVLAESAGGWSRA